MKQRLPLFFAILFGLTVATPSYAGLFDDAEARNQLEQIRKDHGGRLERLEAGSAGQITLSNQIEELRAEVARLRGQVEELTYTVQTLEKRQKDFYLDLDGRLRKFEAAGSTNTPPAAAPGASAPMPPSAPPAANSANEQKDYETALDLLKSGKTAEAQKSFESFIRKYPSSASITNATFWAGQAALQAKEVATANRHFAAVVTRWPDDARAPDAMLGLANTQQTLGDVKGARMTLESLITRYPSSPAAQSAKQRLGK